MHRCIVAALLVLCWLAPSSAMSKRVACRNACWDRVYRCTAVAGKLEQCMRSTWRDCVRNGLETCVGKKKEPPFPWILPAQGILPSATRRDCRDRCAAAIADCIADGGKRAKCTRRTRRQCRRNPTVCSTTTSTSATTTSTSTTSTTILPRHGTGMLVDRVGTTIFENASVMIDVTADARVTFTLTALDHGYFFCWGGGQVRLLQSSLQIAVGGFEGLDVDLDQNGLGCTDLAPGITVTGELLGANEALDLTDGFILNRLGCDHGTGSMCTVTVP